MPNRKLIFNTIIFPLASIGARASQFTISLSSTFCEAPTQPSGASGDGRVAAASRSDYAIAAAAVLTGENHENTVLELGGDQPYTRTELAAEVSRQTGKVIGYNNFAEAEYKKVLGNFLPAVLADAVADAEAHAAQGALEPHQPLAAPKIRLKETR
jgi:uncharacterized protein YbjT (DUF2867 family)